jgi:YfiH family protein
MSDALPTLPAGWRWEHQDGLVLLRSRRLEALGAPHAFTTRAGGVSAPPYDTLNMGRAVGDAPWAVRSNRARVLAALGRLLDHQVEASQVHGAAVAVVDASHRGAKMPGADGMATRDPAVVLAVHCADCVPVLLADPAHGAVAAVHTGWRGTAAGASLAAVRAMAEAFGSRPHELVAAVGPAIGPCCYEVDAPVAAHFAHWPWHDRVLAAAGRGERDDPEGRWRLDLWEANRLQLESSGLPAASISTAPLCTACHRAIFYSHRRDGLTGRMGALIAPPRP